MHPLEKATINRRNTKDSTMYHKVGDPNVKRKDVTVRRWLSLLTMIGIISFVFYIVTNGYNENGSQVRAPAQTHNSSEGASSSTGISFDNEDNKMVEDGDDEYATTEDDSVAASDNGTELGDTKEDDGDVANDDESALAERQQALTKQFSNVMNLDRDNVWPLMPNGVSDNYKMPQSMTLFATSDPAVLQRHECIAHIRERHRSLIEPYLLRQNGGSSPLLPVLYVDPALHGNIGDNLLTEGSLSLFARYNRSDFGTCHYKQALKMAPPCDDVIKEAPEGPKLAFWHPGGNWGDLYRGVQQRRIDSFETILSHSYNIFSLPQSFYYKNDENKSSQTKEIKEGLERGLNVSLDTELGVQVAKERVVFSWREQYSYDEASKEYPFVTNILIPDMAFQLGPYDGSQFEKKVDVVLFLRDDKESNLAYVRDNPSQVDRIFQTITQGQKNITYEIVDWKSRIKLFGNDKHFTEKSLELVSMGKVIVCDRLHAFILSYLSGVPIIYIDQSTMKITKTTGVAFDSWEGCQDGKATKWEHAHNFTHALELAAEYV